MVMRISYWVLFLLRAAPGMIFLCFLFCPLLKFYQWHRKQREDRYKKPLYARQRSRVENYLQCRQRYNGTLKRDAEQDAGQKLHIVEKANLKDGM